GVHNFVSLGCFSFSGAQSFSRAAARSAGMRFTSATTRSSASRRRRSSRRLSCAPRATSSSTAGSGPSPAPAAWSRMSCLSASFAVVTARVRQLARLARFETNETFLELLQEAARAELDHVIALRLLARAVDEVDHEHVAGLRPAPLDRNELGSHRLKLLELRVDHLARHDGLGRTDLELRPVGQLRLRLHLER